MGENCEKCVVCNLDGLEANDAMKCSQCYKLYHFACALLMALPTDPTTWKCAACSTNQPETPKVTGTKPKETKARSKVVEKNPADACVICGKVWDHRSSMIQCTKCPKWFHFKCVGIKRKPPGGYLCSSCETTTDDDEESEKESSEEEEEEMESKKKSPPKVTTKRTSSTKKSIVKSKQSKKVEELKKLIDHSMQQLKEISFANDSSAEESEVESEDSDGSEDEFFDLNDEDVSEDERKRPKKPAGYGKTRQPAKRSKVNRAASADELTRFLMRQEKSELPKWDGEAMNFIFLYEAYEETKDLFSSVVNKNRIAAAIRCPEAKQKVAGLLANPNTVDEAMQVLKDEYGDPEVVIDECIAKARGAATPTERKPETIRAFAMTVKSLATNIKTTGRRDQNMNPTLLKELAEKLPYSLQKRWIKIKRKRVESRRAVTISHFSEWLYEESKDYIGIKAMTSTTPKPIERKDFSSHKPKFVNIQQRVNKNDRKCLNCDQADHWNVDKCPQFKKMTGEQRLDAAKKLKLCFACLKPNHRTPDCRSKAAAEGTKLHELLRRAKNSGSEHSTVLMHAHGHKKSIFRIIPVIINGPAGELKVYAIIDDASEVSIIDQKVASMLQLKGKRQPLTIKWTNDEVCSDENSCFVSMKISGTEKTMQKYEIFAHTFEKLQLPEHSLHINELKKRYPYLKKVQIEHLEKVQPKMLLGLDNLAVTKPWSVESDDNIDGPIAFQTPLGWTVHGPESHYTSKQPMTSMMICDCSPRMRSEEYEKVDEMIVSFFDIENCKESPSPIETPENARAKMILENTTKMFEPKHFETGLLFKTDGMKLPNNYPYALKRLVSIENKMKSNPDYKKKYHEKINSYIDKRYAVKLSPREVRAIDDNIWFLPHFGTSTVSKPKLRLVFDAKAKFRGTSLNDQLLKGPDMYNSLVGVLQRFRQGPFAVVGDIMEMFHMVDIRKEDRRFQCFLWRENEKQSEPDVYQMKAMTFGATCSPCSAQYVKNTNAERFSETFPRSSNAIVKNFYVDDYMDSFATPEDAKKVTQEVININAEGGFNLRNILSNVADIVRDESKKSDAMTMNINQKEEYPTEKVLGVQWNVIEDNFTYKVSFHKIHPEVQLQQRAPTKREFLTILMSVFDPLGLINHFVVRGKVLLQDIWTREIGWDQKIPPDLNDRWKDWFEMLKTVNIVRFPRCYSRLFMSADEIILCVCGDASRNIYAACAYFRIRRGDQIEVALVGGKTKVASKKIAQHQTIPRMELLAAELVTKLAVSVIREHTMPIAEVILCSDSMTVLSWLKMKFGAFKPFVANRVVKIKEALPDANWQFIPSKDNPADEATKVTRVLPFDPNNKWFTGPPNLLKSPLMWEKSQLLEVLPDDPEVYSVCLTKTNRKFNAVRNHEKIDAKDYSCWYKMQQHVAWIQRGIRNLLMKIKKQDINTRWLTSSEMQSAENYLLRDAQQESFSTEYKCLLNHEMISKKSPLWTCSPFIDSKGIIRMSSRIVRADVSYDMKYPIILDRHHPTTKLLINSYHLRFRHQYDEAVVNEMKTKFWIAHLKKAVKGVKANCQVCKNNKTKPVQPEMGKLPIARLDPMNAPFYHTGTDLAGPYEIVIGRNRVEKRWIVLFTCMTFRAVYLDIVVDLTSDSMIQAVLNCNARRGPIKYLYSDNGTNMVGANNELQKSINDIVDDDLRKKCLEKQIEWTFNTPLAPWAAGSWERMVRSVKEILEKLLPTGSKGHGRKLRDHTMRHFLCLCEEVINNRPLTYVSLDSDSEDVLTPKHFLNPTFRATPPPPGEFQDTPQHCRKLWRVIEQMANDFKTQWIKSVLPELTRRSKWFEKASPLQVGDIVIICDPKMKRNQWERGRITSIVPSSDGQVRSVWLETHHGPLKRAAAMLAKLDINSKEVDQL